MSRDRHDCSMSRSRSSSASTHCRAPTHPTRRWQRQNICFFYAPFALLFGFAKDQKWDPALLRACLVTLVGVALLLVFAGYVEFARGQYLISPGGIKPNDFDPYFRVQSLFFDPNIFGRFVAIVMIVVAALLLFTQKTWRVLVCALILACSGRGS